MKNMYSVHAYSLSNYCIKSSRTSTSLIFPIAPKTKCVLDKYWTDFKYIQIGVKLLVKISKSGKMDSSIFHGWKKPQAQPGRNSVSLYLIFMSFVSKIKPLLLFKYPLGPSIETVGSGSVAVPRFSWEMCICWWTLRCSWLAMCACVPLA